jgi:hypothetical protein
LNIEPQQLSLVNLHRMSEDKNKTNYFKHILVGSSLVVASLVGYYFWKSNQIEKKPETKKETEVKLETTIFQQKYKKYLESYEKNNKNEKIFLTTNELVHCLCLIETKEQIESELHKMLKISEKKNIPVSLCLFLQSKNRNFSNEEIFKKVCKFLSQPTCSRKIMEFPITFFNSMIYFLQFTEKNDFELLIVEIIKENRFSKKKLNCLR